MAAEVPATRHRRAHDPALAAAGAERPARHARTEPPAPVDAPVVLEGRVSIEAALTAGVRPVDEILAITPGDRRLAYLRRLAAEHEVPISRCHAGRASRARHRPDPRGRGGSGGGADLPGPSRAPRPSPAPIGLVVMLDGLEDPYNFGQAVRSMFACGRRRTRGPPALVGVRDDNRHPVIRRRERAASHGGGRDPRGGRGRLPGSRDAGCLRLDPPRRELDPRRGPRSGAPSC